MELSKPISPLGHGIIDYTLAGVLFAVPPLLGLPSKTINLYQFLGANVATYNTLSDHGAGIKPVISFKKHVKIDMANIAGLALLSFAKPIRRNKTALVFHLAFLGLAVANVLLTRRPVPKMNFEAKE